MSHGTAGVLAGLAVMVSGLIVFTSLTADEDAAPIEQTVSTQPATQPATQATSQLAPTSPSQPVDLSPAAPEIPGVTISIQRLLESQGNAEVVGPEELTELPPQVARVLIAYGATLRVALPDQEDPGR